MNAGPLPGQPTPPSVPGNTGEQPYSNGESLARELDSRADSLERRARELR